MDQYEQWINRLGRLNQRLVQLEETDYPTAAYKGYSASGQTLEEVQEAIATTTADIATIEKQIADWSRNEFGD